MDDYALGLVHGLVLLPDEEASETFVRASSQIKGSLVVLGRRMYPHVTLAHIRCNRHASLDIWNGLLSDLDLGIFHLEAQRSYLRASDDGYFIGIDLQPSPALQRAHELCLRRCKEYAISVLTDAGTAYRPHLTLGFVDERPPVPISAIVPTELETMTFSATPALALMGAYGTVTQVVEQDRSSASVT